MDPKNPLFEQLVDVCNRERIPLVVGMDSNSHSPLWGCPDKNERGEAQEDIFLSKNLTVMNVGNENTFVSGVGSSIIDVTVMNCSALEKLNLSQWGVSTEATFSDHKYIFYSLGKYQPSEETFRNLKKANWEKFAEVLDEQPLAEIKWDGSNIDDCASSLEKGILVALELACPKKRAVQHPPNPWWNGELDKIRKELKLLHKKCKDSPTNW